MNSAKDMIELASDAVGFSVTGVGLKLVLAVGASDDTETDNQGDTYLGIEATIEDASLIGVDGLALFATGTVKLNQATDADGTTALTPRMDWTTATHESGDTPSGNDTGLLVDLTIESALELNVNGSAAIDVGNGTLVATTGTVDLTLATATVTDDTTTLTGADVISLDVSGAALFAGSGGGLNAGRSAN